MTFIRAIIIWVSFIPVPIINGIIREKLYRQIVGEIVANQISTVILSILFFIYIYLAFKNSINDLSIVKALLIGIFWVILTILFEFVFGHYVDKVSWQKLIDNYNLLKGNWWSLFLLFELISLLVIKLFMKH